MENDTRKEMFDEMKKMHTRLVKLGYAQATIWDDSADDQHTVFTESGERLKQDILKIFDIPKRPLLDVTPNEIHALWLLFVSFPPD